MQRSSKSSKATSCALAGKTARACESCLKRRARWYCASDDAFLCHVCDRSVHLANKLASRHNRVRLGTASFQKDINPNPNFHASLSPPSLPPWQGGFTRKARTPRHNSKRCHKNNPMVVPDYEHYHSDNEGADDQLIFSVPVFNPFEISSSGADHQSEFCGDLKVFGGLDFDISLLGFDDEVDHVPGFLPSDADLAEFAADVETLLVDDDEEERMKGILPLLDDHSKVGYEMKVEDDLYLGESLDLGSVSSCWGLDFKCNDESMVVDKKLSFGIIGEEKRSEINNNKKMFLRLNYDAVISEWASKGGSPWTSGCRPEFDSRDGWPNFTGGVGPTGVENQMGDGGRVARVMRYKEKRKSRLFSKKIRYEVRKLNAEKRPRLKGRFVKRTSSSSSSAIGAHHSFPYLKV